MKEITAYECDHCLKILRTKYGIRRHENRCWKNPAVRSCQTCGHLEDDMTRDEMTRVGWICTEGEATPFSEEIRDCPGHKEGANPFS